MHKAGGRMGCKAGRGRPAPLDPTGPGPSATACGACTPTPTWLTPDSWSSACCIPSAAAPAVLVGIPSSQPASPGPASQPGSPPCRYPPGKTKRGVACAVHRPLCARPREQTGDNRAPQHKDGPHQGVASSRNVSKGFLRGHCQMTPETCLVLALVS